MTKRPYLVVMPYLFLLIGVSAIITISFPIINTFSIMHGNQNSDIPFTSNANKSQSNVIANSTFLKQPGLYALSQHLNNTVSDLMTIAEASMNGSNSFGNLPQVNVTGEMKTKYHGIPGDQDLEKRMEAKELLSNNRALLYVGLLLPNGDRYFGEPYSPYQTNSSIANFAHRDHFTGALETKQPYLSNVINAVSTGEPLAILANPIYSDVKNNNSLIGVQVLGLNFTYFNDLIKSTVSTEGGNKRAVIVDNNGTEISDSSSDNNIMESFKKLQSFQNARNGESGLVIEEVNGKNMSVSYAPIKFAQTNWIVLLLSSIDPNDSINTTSNITKPISNLEIKDYLAKLKNDTLVQTYIKLTDLEIKKLLETLPGWAANNNKLHKTFEFGDFPTMFSFMFKIAETAMIINHHPNMTSTFTTVTIDMDTWNLGHVISNQDEKLARMTENIYQKEYNQTNYFHNQ